MKVFNAYSKSLKILEKKIDYDFVKKILMPNEKYINNSHGKICTSNKELGVPKNEEGKTISILSNNNLCIKFDEKDKKIYSPAIINICGKKYVFSSNLNKLIGMYDRVKNSKVLFSAMFEKPENKFHRLIILEMNHSFYIIGEISKVGKSANYLKMLYREDGDYTLICVKGKYDFKNKIAEMPDYESSEYVMGSELSEDPENSNEYYENDKNNSDAFFGGNVAKYNIIPGMVRERKYMIYSYGEDGKIEIEGVEKRYNKLMVGGVTVALEIGNERYGIVGRDKNMILLKKISNNSRE